MSNRAKALLLVACIVALMTFFCPRKVNSRRLPAAEGKNHIGETAKACGKVVATNWAARKDFVPLGHCLPDLPRALPFEFHNRL